MYEDGQRAKRMNNNNKLPDENFKIINKTTKYVEDTTPYKKKGELLFGLCYSAAKMAEDNR
jgi:hypothetical protein